MVVSLQFQERESLQVLVPPEGQEGRKDGMEAEGEQGHMTPGCKTGRMGILVVVFIYSCLSIQL